MNPPILLTLCGLGASEIFFLLFWCIFPMAIYYRLRSRNKKKPVTGTEYLITIPLFLLFGWFTLLCIWLIHLLRNKPNR